MNDRELLAEIYEFLRHRNYITVDKKSVVDMVQRYQNPPLTLLNRAAMQMTLSEYAAFSKLLKRIGEQLKEPEHG
jgi:hypothetical protein